MLDETVESWAKREKKECARNVVHLVESTNVGNSIYINKKMHSAKHIADLISMISYLVAMDPETMIEEDGKFIDPWSDEFLFDENYSKKFLLVKQFLYEQYRAVGIEVDFSTSMYWKGIATRLGMKENFWEDTKYLYSITFQPKFRELAKTVLRAPITIALREAIDKFPILKGDVYTLYQGVAYDIRKEKTSLIIEMAEHELTNRGKVGTNLKEYVKEYICDYLGYDKKSLLSAKRVMKENGMKALPFSAEPSEEYSEIFDLLAAADIFRFEDGNTIKTDKNFEHTMALELPEAMHM